MRSFNPFSTCPPSQLSVQVLQGEDEAEVEVAPGLLANLSPGYHKFEIPGSGCVTYVSVSGITWQVQISVINFFLNVYEIA